jgi:hypothetical protein
MDESEGLDAKVAGQHVGIRSAYPVVLVLLVCVVPVLTWLMQQERKELMQQMLGLLTTIAEKQHDDFTELRALGEAHHREAMARQLEIARAWLRVMGWMAHNRDLPPEHRLPFGAIPPGLEEQLKKQLPAQ